MINDEERECLEYIHALESAVMELAAPKDVIPLYLDALRDKFAPTIKDGLYDWKEGVRNGDR